MNTLCILLIATSATQGVPPAVQQAALKEIQTQWNAIHPQTPLTQDKERGCLRSMRYQFDDRSLHMEDLGKGQRLTFELNSLLGQESQTHLFPTLSPQPFAPDGWRKSSEISTKTWVTWGLLAVAASGTAYFLYQRHRTKSEAVPVKPMNSLQTVKQWSF